MPLTEFLWPSYPGNYIHSTYVGTILTLVTFIKYVNIIKDFSI